MEIVIPEKFNALNAAGRKCLSETAHDLSGYYSNFEIVVTDMKHSWSVTIALFKDNRRFVTFNFNSLADHKYLLWKIIMEIECEFPKEPRPQKFEDTYPPQ